MRTFIPALVVSLVFTACIQPQKPTGDDVAGEAGDGDADELPIVVGLKAEVRFQDGLLDVAGDAAIEGTDDQLARVRRADSPKLLERGGYSVCIHLQIVDERRGSAASAYGPVFVLENGDRTLHFFFGFKKDFIYWHGVVS